MNPKRTPATNERTTNEAKRDDIDHDMVRGLKEIAAIHPSYAELLVRTAKRFSTS